MSAAVHIINNFITFFLFSFLSVPPSIDNLGLSRAGGLIIEYTFDNITGTTINDTSGCGNNASSSGLIAATGLVGDEISNATMEGYAQNASVTANGCTMTGFFKQTSVNTTKISRPFDIGLCGGFFIENEKSSYLANIYVDLTANSTNVGQHTFPQNVREFIAARRTSTGWKLRFNNNADTEYSVIGNQITQGFYVLNHRAEKIRGWYGNVDQLRVYGRELEDYELDNIYNNGFGC